MTFWEHLEELRGVLLRAAVVALVCCVAAFCLKDALFRLLLAPTRADFLTYRLLGLASEEDGFSLHLVGTGLTEQFTAHLHAAISIGIFGASPYILYVLFRFVSPGLYKNEQRLARQFVGGAWGLFLLGILVAYFLVFPLAVRFLGTYQVSEDVAMLITLQSYLDTFLGISLCMGIVFQLPLVTWLLSRFGLLSAAMMRRYRRHAFVLLLTLSAVITPTGDPVTLFAVTLPLYALYEVGIFFSRSARSQANAH